MDTDKPEEAASPLTACPTLALKTNHGTKMSKMFNQHSTHCSDWQVLSSIIFFKLCTENRLYMPQMLFMYLLL